MLLQLSQRPQTSRENIFCWPDIALKQLVTSHYSLCGSRQAANDLLSEDSSLWGKTNQSQKRVILFAFYHSWSKSVPLCPPHTAAAQSVQQTSFYCPTTLLLHRKEDWYFAAPPSYSSRQPACSAVFPGQEGAHHIIRNTRKVWSLSNLSSQLLCQMLLRHAQCLATRLSALGSLVGSCS